MKKMNKKGFTIVELVIVIAVIAILAAVLIPTFSGVVSKANQSAALQEATSTMKSSLAMSSNGTLSDGTLFVIGDKDGVNYAYEYDNNKIAEYTDKQIQSGSFYATNQTTFNTTNAVAAVAYNTSDTGNKYNSIIISSDCATNDVTILKIVNNTLKPTTDITALTAVNDSTKSYKYTFSDEGNTWNVYTNADFAKDIVVFTYSK